MSSLVILGTDTDAGKTTLALLLLARFTDRLIAWKPVETGESDSERYRQLVPAAQIHPPVMKLKKAVAPPLAARFEGRVIPSARKIAESRPPGRLLIETFGGPFSPLNESELQIDLLQLLDEPSLLVGASTVGAVGRILGMVHALSTTGVRPRGIVLVGPRDEWAEESIGARSGIPVFPIVAPTAFQDSEGPWTPKVVRHAADIQSPVLDRIMQLFDSPAPSPDDAWRQIDRACVWHPYTSLQDPDEPLAIVGADAEFLHLADGRRIIDGISSWWTIQHGHRHPPLMQALAAASREIDHVIFAGATHPWGAKLAQQLLATAPWNGGKVFYSDNGSTAIEVALKMAVQYWQHRGQEDRTLFVGFENSYHGDTFGAMALSRDPVFFGRFEPLLCRAEILPLDPDRLDLFLTQHADEVAAILIEPILQAAGGMRLHSEQTLRDLFDVARRHDVLFIADEVMTGLGRTGTFWAHSAAEIEPDLIATAKTLAGGILPLAATLVSPRIVEAFDTADRSRTFFHGHSFTAHPLACALGVANIPLTLGCLPEVPRAIESFWRQSLAEIETLPGVRDIRFRGVMAAVEMNVPGGYLANVGRGMKQAALERGVLLRPLGNVLYALPPWRASRASLERIADAMKAAVLSTQTVVRG